MAQSQPPMTSYSLLPNSPSKDVNSLGDGDSCVRIISGLKSKDSLTIFRLRPLQLIVTTLIELGLDIFFDFPNVGLTPLRRDLNSSAKMHVVSIQHPQTINGKIFLIKSIDTRQIMIPMVDQTQIGGMFSAESLSCLIPTEIMIKKFNPKEINTRARPMYKENDLSKFINLLYLNFPTLI